jgi:putative transposase
VALKYDFAYRRKAKGSIGEETKRLALRMARENPTWGYSRIQGALSKLKHRIGRTSLVRLLREAGLDPSPERSKQIGWSTFLKRHWDVLAAADFFTVEVWTARGLVRYSVFFVIDLATRELKVVHIGCQWNGEQMVQLARDLTDPIEGFLRGKRYLIVDRDPLYTWAFRELLRSSGTTVLNLPPGAYVMNTYAERFVRTICSECLDHLVLFGERSLVKAAREFEKHYNRERNDQALENRIIRPDPQVFEGQCAAQCVEHLGGLLKFYRREAAWGSQNVSIQDRSLPNFDFIRYGTVPPRLTGSVPPL